MGKRIAYSSLNLEISGTKRVNDKKHKQFAVGECICRTWDIRDDEVLLLPHFRDPSPRVSILKVSERGCRLC